MYNTLYVYIVYYTAVISNNHSIPQPCRFVVRWLDCQGQDSQRGRPRSGDSQGQGGYSRGQISREVHLPNQVGRCRVFLQASARDRNSQGDRLFQRHLFWENWENSMAFSNDFNIID